MHKLLPALAPAVLLVGLPASPADARVDPVVLIHRSPTPESCVVPAAGVEPSCGPLRAPDRARPSACNLPAVYLGGRPGPCPEPEVPPRSRVIPIAPPGIIR